MKPSKPHEGLGRRAWLQAAGATALTLGLPGLGRAQGSYPNQPIRIVIPFAAGGTLDVAVRPLAQVMSGPLGQNIIIDNKAGANGVIGTEYVARAAPDGYTLLAVTASFALNATMYKDLRYDVIKDFAPVAGLMQGTGFVLIVHPSVPANTVQELIALDRKAPGKLTYSSPGVGNTIHIATELFNQRAGTQLLHVPYKGSAPSLQAVVSGEAQVAIMPPGIVMPFIRSGKLRALGFTGPQRMPELPEVPIMAEAGVKDFVFSGTWMGLFAPAATPRPIVNRLHAEVVKALQQPALRQTLAGAVAGYVPDGSTPEHFGAQVQDDVKRYGDILRKFNIKAD
ncbi:MULTISPECIES: Bug family tripartite tricarboxylate transporter substrate binding protein [Ramlibacter]|uniref:Tripartite tricarboxylate transporter substrate binding protein n=1 Tax=Ramlibacter pinisoli TaxID=2682844 RepID=A0A6N8INU2_9BURK|nr:MULTISPECIES: tripartite tricarboxylate transporter substrate binding protein [Ramlibacter]MBA2963531.1 tripartite tricarboxylate transporter substrate binding protein [Ramlibacter sp. CGMCC 1.13660]MVQ28498.1 tripartite tricarboxylate transporter substrate binding protein [Ramlibacter pinisoli]